MGAWGVEVLENDSALDAMDNGESIISMFASEDPALKLLGVALVDASINGADESIFGLFYDHEDYIKGLAPMENYRPLAIKNLQVVKEDITSWFEEYRNDRMALLNRIEKRLAQ